MATKKSQRIRDPLHDLIMFAGDEFESSLWGLINSREFQRLRRIKQLGFSELVFPGATHTRFAHSVGVFHTARLLMEQIKSKIADFSKDEAQIAIAAALVHDLGHGPFSHAFEEAIKALDKDASERNGTKPKALKKHEVWTTEIITGDTDIASRIKKDLPDLQQEIADLLKAETPRNIYAAVVSSQFDADRLDYVRRDRLMTGAQHGGFDFSWLLANLEIGKISLSIDDEEFQTVDSLVLGQKAFQAAEAYVLGLFHLYFAVYFHKTTRSAEQMLTAILRRIGRLCADGEFEKTGLSSGNPIVKFIMNRDLESYLECDDFVVWGSLSMMTQCDDEVLRDLSRRLLQRELYKSKDITNHFEHRGGDAAVATFRARLSEAKRNGDFEEYEIFEDRPSRDPYKRRGHGSPEALSKIHILTADGRELSDLNDSSDVVKALEKKSLYRVYVRDEKARDKIKSILGED